MNKSIFKVLVIALCIFGMDGCKPETKPKPDPLQVVCTLSNLSPVPMQVVFVDCSEDVFIDSFYQGDLSGSSIKLVKVSIKQLAFIVPPETVTGDKVLKFTLPSGEVSLVLSVSSPTVILTVPDVINSIDNALEKIKILEKNADTLIASGKYNKADLDFLKAINDSMLAYKTKFTNATPEVQKYALLYMAANQQSLTNLYSIANGYNDMGLNKKGFSNWLSNFGGTLVVPTIIGGITALLVPPVAVASLGFASAVGLGAIIGWSIEKTQALGALSKIKELITVADNKKEIPADLTLSVEQYEANVETPVSSDITYRTIEAKDETSTSQVLSGYVKNFKTLRTEWSRYVRKSLGDLPDFVTKSVVGKPKPQAKIKAEIVGQPDLTIEVKGTPDKYTLMMKTANQQLKDVNIKITYDEQVMGEISKMIAIKLGTKCIVTTGVATAIGLNQATIPVSILTGGLTITSRGICYGTSPSPTIANDKYATLGSGPGSFSAQINGLNSASTYYARAFAVTSAGGNYGNEVSFTTLATKDLLFRNGWKVVSVTETATRGSLSIDQTIDPNWKSYDTCGGNFYSVYNAYNDGTGGLSVIFNDPYLSIDFKYSSERVYTLYRTPSCSLEYKRTLPAGVHKSRIMNFNGDSYNESTKTYKSLDPLIWGKVLQISNTSATLEFHNYIGQTKGNDLSKYIINLSY